jgi:hypothetical protein
MHLYAQLVPAIGGGEDDVGVAEAVAQFIGRPEIGRKDLLEGGVPGVREEHPSALAVGD